MEGTELISTLRDLEKLPSGIHIFCPRETEGEHDRYEEDEGDLEQVKDEVRYEQIRRAKDRRKKFVRCTQLLAFDGEESLPYQEAIYRILDTNLKRCDTCVRRYYLERVEFVAELRQDYQESEIQDFLSILDRRDIERIKEGLTNGTQKLRDTPETKRGIAAIDYPDLVALFEALHCRRFHENETLLRQYFDEPFKLIQSKRPLRIGEILPAVTLFLFDQNLDRMKWALDTWMRLPRPPTDLEWEYAIRDILQLKIRSSNSPTSSNKLWSALTVITRKLDSKAITHKLFEFNPPFHRLILDHLAQPTFAVPHIIHTLHEVLAKSPEAFWQSMGSISSSQLVESVFGSPKFDLCLEKSVKPDAVQDQRVLNWIPVFLKSLKLASQPSACQTLVYQLLQKIRSDTVSNEAKTACFKMATQCIHQTLLNFSADEAVRKTTSRLVVSDALNIVSTYLDELLQPNKDLVTSEVRAETMSIVRNSLALECLCLKDDFDELMEQRPLKHESSSYSPDIWTAVTNNLQVQDIELSQQVLLGITSFTGIDEVNLRSKLPEKCSPQTRARIEQAHAQFKKFNSVFHHIDTSISRIFEKIAAFNDPNHYDMLCKDQNASMTIFAGLFSGNDDTYEAAVDIIKIISGTYGRTEALGHLLSAFFNTSVFAIDWVLRRLANMRTFPSIPRVLRLGREILELLCDSTGILRGRKLDARGYAAVQNYWSYQWAILHTIFRHMERWSMEQSDKTRMMEICQDTMQYAKMLFDQYHLFLNVLRDARPERYDDVPKILLNSDETSSNTSPATVLHAMSLWLRLRDQFLADTLSDLLVKMLKQLKEYGATLPEERLHYICAAVIPGFKDRKHGARPVKTNLLATQKAQLVRALEHFLGTRLVEHPSVKKQLKIKDYIDKTGSPLAQEVISLVEEEDYGDDDIKDSDLYALSEQHEAIQRAKRSIGENKQQTKPKPPSSQKLQRPSVQGLQVKQPEVARSFIERRRAEEAAAKARRAEASARLKGQFGVGEHTSGAGSGLSGIGVTGKDHAKEKSVLMVSSESEGDSDDEDELFGKLPKTLNASTGLPRKPLPAGPMRKVKQLRSQKDIRARLTPDLSGLHKEILSWDFFADTDTPPTSSKTDYTLVTNTFRSAADYVKTFEPLLILEGWQSFRAAREDGSFRSFELKVASSLIVDNFVEVTTVVPMAEGKELGIGVSEVILLSKGKRPESDKNEPHCLARVKEISRKKGEMQIVYRVNAANNALRPFLGGQGTIYGIQILSLTPLEREYSALMALEYYDLCDEIIRAKPSPLLEYKESELGSIKQTYNVNSAQARAVKSALDNDAFTLVQGPPGSGKTKTICAIVGAILTGYLNKSASKQIQANGRIAPPPAAKKILVCAPSNAAVDELVMRFKDGVKMIDGSDEKINVVRLGRSDAINTAVKDVTLEELVNARLNTTAPKESKEDIHSVMMEHKATSEEQREQLQKLDQMRSQGKVPSAEDEKLLEGLKRKKAMLGTKIDDMRSQQNNTIRDADINRRRVQQEILDTAHVLCATLSGSGHEIFQSLSIEFETVIIDEAAQSIELSALIPLKYGCNKCILVGDPKQLPPTVLSREAARFQYEQSLFARMEGNHKRDVHLLDTQYRMHPEISMFPSKMFYDSRLKDGIGMAKLRARPWHHSEIFAPYRFFDVQGMSQTATKGHSLVNFAEINVAMQLYDRLVTDVIQYKFRGKIGIITPYKGQLKELKMRFRNRYGESILSDIEFNTTDAFQGRESEIIIFSCVRASTSGLGFLNDIRRMNVGLTRAKCSLWVLGNSEALTKGEYWRGLVNDAKSRNLYTNGDIINLLRQPLLTPDMMKEDVVMDDAGPLVTTEPSLRPIVSRTTSIESQNQTPTASRATSASSVRQSKESVVIKNPKVESGHSLEPLSHHSSRASTPAQHVKREPPAGTHAETKTQGIPPKPRMNSSTPEPGQSSKSTERPSGGSFGLNEKANCSRCGSSKHFAHDCDNTAAHAAIGLCHRCDQPGHTQIFCQQPRCIQCGTVGHLQTACGMPQKQHLSRGEREEVQKQEIEFGRAQQRARERRAEKRQGDHAAKIPEVKNVTVSETDLKRKREDGSRSLAVKVAKTSRTEGGGRGGVTEGGPVGVSNGQSRPMESNGGIRPPGSGRPTGAGAPAPVVRRKKPAAEAMFVKRK